MPAIAAGMPSATESIATQAWQWHPTRRRISAMSARPLSDAQFAEFQRDGYVLARRLFDAAEMDLLLAYARQDPALVTSAYARKDSSGAETKLALWNHPGDNLYSMFSRSPRIVDAMEQLLGGEVYHYHSKMMLKEPLVG